MDLNPKNNPVRRKRYVPTDAEKLFLRQHHGISWHKTGGWCRKFPGDHGKRTYWGWIPPAAAVKAHNAAAERRARGEAAKPRTRSLTLAQAVNLFLTHLDGQLASGKIGIEQRAKYGQELDAMLTILGKGRPLSDFAGSGGPALFAKLRAAAVHRGIFAGEKHVVQVRTFFDWCSSTRRYMLAPFYADSFDAPGEKEKRAVRKTRRRERGTAYWTPAEVREIVAAAKATDVHRYAQVLTMLNGGMGSTDIALLEDADIDWQRGCISTERSKTLVPRVVPLWPETLAALTASRAARAKSAKPQWGSRVFLTPKGVPLVVVELDTSEIPAKVKRTDSVRNWFFRLLNAEGRKPGREYKAAGIRLKHLKRERAGAYTLRAVFATLARGHAGDPNLDAIILGQQLDRAILATYVRGDLLAKLKVVSSHVHLQIWPDAPASP